MEVFSVGYDAESTGLCFTGQVSHADGPASYRAVLNCAAATTLGELLRSEEWRVDESFDFDDVAGTVTVGADDHPLARINAYRVFQYDDVTVHVDFLKAGDLRDEPSGNLQLVDLRDPGAALLGQIRGCHEIGVIEPELVLAVLQSGVSLAEVESALNHQPVTDQLDGLKAVAALRGDDLPVRLSEDGRFIVIGRTA